MVYTNLGRIAAALIFLFGIVSVCFGVFVATSTTVEPESARDLATRMAGPAVDYRIYSIIVAIALGVLTDISQSIARLRQ